MKDIDPEEARSETFSHTYSLYAVLHKEILSFRSSKVDHYTSLMISLKILKPAK